VAVSVRDNGIGIPRANLENIFDMFTQVDRSNERNSSGLGIGLALVKGLVEMHGGTVAAASEGEGKGSEFTVRLPPA
jgi:signal transduction histidine kinase